MASSQRLHGKIAIVTGGGSGIGEGIVRKFVDEGAKVTIFDIDRKNTARVAEDFSLNQVGMYVGDVLNEMDWKTAVEMCTIGFGGLDIVVNNAGVVHCSGPSTEVAQDEYQRIMDINVRPLYHSAKAVQPHFTSQNRGVYVNISSVSALRPRPNMVWYAGSKGAVSAITKGLAAEWAPLGIRANTICPVVAETGMVTNVLGGTDTPEGRARMAKGIPLGRLATPRDVANAACFLASDEASFITGIELPVDGGRSLK